MALDVWTADERQPEDGELIAVTFSGEGELYFGSFQGDRFQPIVESMAPEYRRRESLDRRDIEYWRPLTEKEEQFFSEIIQKSAPSTA